MPSAGDKIRASDLNSLFVSKTANESVASSTVLQNDDELVLTMAANTTYHVEGGIGCEGINAVAPNLKIGFTGPASATMQWGFLMSKGSPLWSATIGGTFSWQDSAFATGDDVFATLSGLLVVTTLGTLQLQWAQSTSSATATTVFAGSWLKATPVS